MGMNAKHSKLHTNLHRQLGNKWFSTFLPVIEEGLGGGYRLSTTK